MLVAKLLNLCQFMAINSYLPSGLFPLKISVLLSVTENFSVNMAHQVSMLYIKLTRLRAVQ